MSFIRPTDSGVICCIAPLIDSNIWLASWPRSRSSSASNAPSADADVKS